MLVGVCTPALREGGDGMYVEYVCMYVRRKVR